MTDSVIYTKKNFENIKKLYKNALWYQQSGELQGALISYSSCVSIINTLLEIAKTSEDRAAQKVTSSDDGAVASKELLGSASSVPSPDSSKSSVTEDKINEFLKPSNNCEQESDHCKKILNDLWARCLTQIGSLQEDLQREKASQIQPSDEDDKDEDWGQLCSNIHDIVFKRGSSNCIFFDDLAGLKKEKDLIVNSLIKPLIYPSLFPSIGKGFLLYGPPGTGKTLLAKAAANQLQIEDDSIRVLFFAPTGADLKGKYVGETEKNITKYFTCASRAACIAEKNCRKRTISILFIDELDSIARNRSNDTSGIGSNSVNTLLQMMDGVLSFDNVAVIGATNYPWELDAAVLRRFDTQILLDLPSIEGIEKAMMLEFDKFINLKEKIYDACDRPSAQSRGDQPISQTENDAMSKDDSCNFECEPGTTKISKYAKAPYNEFSYSFINSRESGRITAFAQHMKSENYSYSDVSRIMKRSSTLTALNSLENGLFYKLEGIISGLDGIDNAENIYISSLNLPGGVQRTKLHKNYYIALSKLITGNDEGVKFIGASLVSNPPVATGGSLGVVGALDKAVNASESLNDDYANSTIEKIRSDYSQDRRVEYLTEFFKRFYINNPPKNYAINVGKNVYWNSRILLDLDPNLNIEDSSIKETFILVNLSLVPYLYQENPYSIDTRDGVLKNLYGEKLEKPETLESILSSINALNFPRARKKHLVKSWVPNWHKTITFGEDAGKITEADEEYVKSASLGYVTNESGKTPTDKMPFYSTVKVIANYTQPIEWGGEDFNGDSFLTNSFNILKKNIQNYIGKYFRIISVFRDDLTNILSGENEKIWNGMKEEVLSDLSGCPSKKTLIEKTFDIDVFFFFP